MGLLQTFRRIGQTQEWSWNEAIDLLHWQFPLVEKLFARNGLEIQLTCEACPEQYEIFKERKQVAYFRLRHGEFRVDYPDCGDETIYEAEPNGEGIFEPNERLVYLAKAMREVLKRLAA